MFSTRALTLALLILVVVGSGLIIRQCRHAPVPTPKPLLHQELPEE